jgi:arylformamidase
MTYQLLNVSMQYFDISRPISNDMVVWPDDPPVELYPIEPNSPVIVSRLVCSSHTGTHIDVQRHVFPQGQTVDQVDFNKLIGPCQVIAIKSATPLILVQDLLDHQITPGSRILFKTNNSKLLEDTHFHQNYVSLSLEAAQYLADRDIALVGIDYLSVEPFGQADMLIHKTLLTKQVVILEGIYLEAVPPGRYQLTCLPLNLQHADGAPCRAVLSSR